MKVAVLTLALPALSQAQQIPLLDNLKDWFAKATGAAVSAAGSVPSAASVPNPAKAAASVVTDLAVDHLSASNVKEILRPGAATASPGLEEWMIYVTGGNKTCFAMCEHSDLEWAKSIPLLAASRSPPHLGQLDCETDGALCSAWQAYPPSVIHMLLPQPLPDQSVPATSVRFISLNWTDSSAAEIAEIHTQEKYKDEKPYEGFWHPFDSTIAQTGLNIPLGYAIKGMGMIPSWMFMIIISFASRSVMNRRMGTGTAPRPAAAT